MIKIFTFIFVFAILIVIYELWQIAKAIYTGNLYNTTKNRLIVFGLAISYIITMLITGFHI